MAEPRVATNGEVDGPMAAASERPLETPSELIVPARNMVPIRRLPSWCCFLLFLASPILAADKNGGTPQSRPTPTPRPKNPLDYDLQPPEKFSRDGKPLISNLVVKKFTDAQFRARLKLASRALDEWSQRVEEYGSVTMSSPILTEDHGAFNFTIKDGPDEFYAHAKTRKDGSAAATLAIVNQLSIAAEATIDPLAKAQIATALKNYNADQRTYEEQIQANNDAAEAMRKAARLQRKADLEAASKADPSERTAKEVEAQRKYAEAIKQNPLDAPDFPEVATKGGVTDEHATTVVANTAKTNLDNADSSISNNFLKSIGGLTDGTPIGQLTLPGELPDRTALIDAAGTNTVKAIFGILGRPAEAMKFKDKAVVFATVAVAVNPGWRTQRDFAADISGQASYRLIKARPEVVLALRNRIPEEYRKLLFAAHGIQKDVEKADARDKNAQSPAQVELAATLADAEQELAEDVADRNRAKIEADKAATAIQRDREEFKKDAPAIDAKRESIKALFTQPGPPNTYRQMLQAVPLGTQGAIAAPQNSETPEQLAEGAIRALSVATSTARKRLPNTEAATLRQKLDEVSRAVKTMRALNAANATTGAPLFDNTIIAHGMSLETSLTEGLQPATALKNTNDKVEQQSSKVNDLRVALRDSGAFSSGSGAGSLGLLQPPKAYFDKVMFEKQPPLVAGISPLMETQVLDLKDSYGRQDQVAIALAAALRQGGQKGSAQIFDRYMRQQTKAAVTLSSLPVVNTFSASGGLFGFQVGPRLRALRDPAARSGGSANVLDRQSFPAVLIIGMDRADLSPVICWDYDNKPWVFEPQLLIKQTSRWNPLDGKLFTPFKDPWWNPLSWHNPRYSERDRVDNLISVADNFRDLDIWLQNENTLSYYHANGSEGDASKAGAEGTFSDFYRDYSRHPYAGVVQSLIRRRDALEELCTGSESRQYLPLDVLVPEEPKPAKEAEEPGIVSVVPSAISAQAPSAPPAANAGQIAQTRAGFNGQLAQYKSLQGITKSAIDEAIAAIKLNLGTTEKLKALISSSYEPPATGKPARVPTPDEMNKWGTHLRNLHAPLQQVSIALADLDAIVDRIQTVLAPATTGDPVANMDSLPEILEAQRVILDAKVALIPAAFTVPKDEAALRAASIERDTIMNYASDALREIPALRDKARGFKSLMQIGPNSANVAFTILGENFDGLTEIAASEGNSVIEWTQPGIPAGNWIKTERLKNSIMMQVTIHSSAALHFRLKFETKDPKTPGKVIERTLYTPSLMLTFGTQPPTATGAGYYDKDGHPVATVTQPGNSPTVRHVSIPPRAQAIVKRTVEIPTESGIDFTRDPFMPLTAK